MSGGRRIGAGAVRFVAEHVRRAGRIALATAGLLHRVEAEVRARTGLADGLEAGLARSAAPGSDPAPGNARPLIRLAVAGHGGLADLAGGAVGVRRTFGGTAKARAPEDPGPDAQVGRIPRQLRPHPPGAPETGFEAGEAFERVVVQVEGESELLVADANALFPADLAVPASQAEVRLVGAAERRTAQPELQGLFVEIWPGSVDVVRQKGSKAISEPPAPDAGGAAGRKPVEVEAEDLTVVAQACHRSRASGSGAPQAGAALPGSQAQTQVSATQ